MLRASCIGTAKLLDFTTFPDTELIHWDKVKENFVLPCNQPSPANRSHVLFAEVRGVFDRRREQT